MAGGIQSWLRDKFAGPVASNDEAGTERVCMVAGEAMGEKYSVMDRVVPAPPSSLTQEEYRHLIATGMLHPVHELGPTKVGLRIGCNEQTVRDARDKKSTLRGDLSWNMLLVDEHALDAVAAHFGKAIVDKNPAPVDWTQLGIASLELGAEIMRANAKGHVSHLDLPRLKALVRRVIAAGQGAA